VPVPNSRREFLVAAGVLATSVGVAGRSLAQQGSLSTTDSDAPTTAWSQFRADPARTGSVAPDAAPGGEFATTSWYSNIGTYVGLVSGALPVVGDGAVYRPFVVNDVQFRGGVVAFDAETGEERWRHVAPGYSRDTGWPTGIGAAVGTPAVGDGHLFVTSEAGTSDAEYGGLHALDSETGAISWAKTEESDDGEGDEHRWYGTPILSGGTLYVARGGGPEATTVVAALDPETGELQWTTGGRPDVRLFGLADGTLYGGVYEPRDRYIDHGAFALAASDVAPDSENLPISSDAPVARVTTDPDDAATTNLDAGTTVDLDGSTSTGDVETYEWDLDGTARSRRRDGPPAPRSTSAGHSPSLCV
jgi:outer membrane protein assembly factor BamB